MRIKTLWLVVAVTAMTVMLSSTASASLRSTYVEVRSEAKKQLPKGEVGPDLRAGVRSPSGKTVRAKPRHYAAAIRMLRAKMTAPEWTIPSYIVWCESRFKNMPPNGAGASGYYQILRSTWAAAGGLRYAAEAWLASKYEQGVIALRIWNNQAYYGGWDCA